jgi:hydrogenase expression/formation protein HypC
MCIGIPGRITAIIDAAQRIAEVEIAGRSRAVNLGLLCADEGAIGDWVLVHAGLAISQLDADAAHSILTLLQEFDQLDKES